MPTIYKRSTCRRALWSEEDLLRAVKAIKEENVPVRQASRVYNIPERTLRRRILNADFKKHTLGPSSCLGRDAEKKLVQHIKNLQNFGFAPDRLTVSKIAYDLATELGIAHKFSKAKGKAGKDWFESFLRRNPELSLKKAQGVLAARTLGMCREDVSEYFKILRKALHELHIASKPGHIYNMDEIELQLNNESGAVIGNNGSEVASSEKGETISVITCCNAEGAFLPPYCVFKGKNKKPEFENNMPTGSYVIMSQESAYVTGEIFRHWLENHFKPRKPDGKVLLVLDGHAYHMKSIDTLQFAKDNDIELLCLPSYSTHYLQPLDRSFFKLLKSYFQKASTTWMNANPGKNIGRLQFGELLTAAWGRAATVDSGSAGFKACGIYPFNPDAIPNNAFSISDYSSLPEESAIGSCSNERIKEGNNSDASDSMRAIMVENLISKKKNLESGPISTANTSSSGVTEADITFDKDKDGCSGAMDSIKLEDYSVSHVTPTKVLIKVSPVPEVKIKVEQNMKQHASLLTSSSNITENKSKRSSKDRMDGKKETSVQSKKPKKSLFLESSNSNDSDTYSLASSDPAKPDEN